MPTKSVSMVKLANFPVFSTKTQKNQLLQKKCQNSPWTNFHHLGNKFFFCSLKSHEIVSNEHKRRKKRKNGNLVFGIRLLCVGLLISHWVA
jgi:predicted nucleic acid-binding Zn ribbon protein